MSEKTLGLKFNWLIPLALLFLPRLAQAQIIPDGTLPNSTQVILNGKTTVIEGGTRRGNNLFHSFERFSLPTKSEAFLNNALDIQNIFSRVTGNAISNIDGLIRANGAANLFLINPNGIIFGPNAQLDIGGSFLASTASSLNFADGTQFSATARENTPLLTISVPIGLQLAGEPGLIQVQGTGHSLVNYPVFTPFRGRNPGNSFQVKAGQTLALIGGNIVLEGGILTTESGTIELGSIDSGAVRFDSTSARWSFNYEGVLDFKDIQLSSKSLIDVAGIDRKAVQLRGANISMTDGSLILFYNQGLGSAGSLNIEASELVELRGISDDRLTRSGLYSVNTGIGQGANIIVSAPELRVEDAAINTSASDIAPGGDIRLRIQKLILNNGGNIGTITSGGAKGGNLEIDADESIRVVGVSPLFSDLFSAITSNTRGSGDGGNINISTQQLMISERGAIGTNAIRGTGKGGDVTLNVSDSVTIVGGTGFATSSALASSTFSRGDAGTLTLNTSKVLIQDGAAITASTFGIGNAGKLFINASDSVKIRGGSISSSATQPAESLRQFLGLPLELSGSSGGLTIETPILEIKDGSQVTVRNDGTGNAGTLQINADSVRLDNQAGITASTQSGEGGDISINSPDLFLLRRNSKISAEARGTGNGGNINISTPFIVAVPSEDSDIIANAFQGRGGNINIKTQGIYGLEYRSRLTFLSDITASSDFGVNGTVEINTQDTDPSRALVTLPTQPVDATGLIAQGCPGTVGPRASKFVVTGRGGIPENPNEMLNSDKIWTDLRPTPHPALERPRSPSATSPTAPAKEPLVEATGWTFNSKGEVVLTAAAPNIEVPWLTPSSCYAS